MYSTSLAFFTASAASHRARSVHRARLFAEALEHVLGGHGALRLPEGAERPEELLDAGGVNDVSVRRSGGGAGRKAAAYGYGYGHGYGSGRRGGAYGGDEDYDSDDE